MSRFKTCYQVCRRSVGEESALRSNATTRSSHVAPQRRLFFEPLEDRRVLNAEFPEFVDPNPAPGNRFGHTVVPLSTGNVVITSPFDDAGGNGIIDVMLGPLGNRRWPAGIR